MTVLQLEDLYCAFGSLVVTKNISLAIKRGERHCIIGPNGAGKTSLLNQIGGQLRPNAGHILVEGTEITHWPPNRIAQAGVARTFQRNNLFFNLSVLENLQLAVAARRSLPWNFWTVADRIRPIVNHAGTLLARVQITGDRGDLFAISLMASNVNWKLALRSLLIQSCSYLTSRPRECRRPKRIG